MKLSGLGRQQRSLETAFALAVDDDQVFEVRQIAAHALRHRRVVEPTIGLRDYENLGLAEVQDVDQLTLPQDRHHRIHHGADLAARKRGDDELPPVRQLHRDNVTASDAEPEQRAGGTVREPFQFLVGQARGLLAIRPIGDDCHFVGRLGARLSQKLINGLVQPISGFPKPDVRRISFCGYCHFSLLQCSFPNSMFGFILASVPYFILRYSANWQDCRFSDRERRDRHLPSNTGLRFSTNALTPSRASAVREIAASVCASSSNWLSTDRSSVWENKRLIAPYASVGPAASSRAIRSASPCTAPSGTTKSTSPSDRAVLAYSVSPSRKKRLARATPMRRVTVVVDPLSGLNPIFAKADEMRADSAMTTRSAAAISDTLPPATLPETAATTGARIRTIRAIAA